MKKEKKRQMAILGSKGGKKHQLLGVFREFFEKIALILSANF